MTFLPFCSLYSANVFSDNLSRLFYLILLCMVIRMEHLGARRAHGAPSTPNAGRLCCLWCLTHPGSRSFCVTSCKLASSTARLAAAGPRVGRTAPLAAAGSRVGRTARLAAAGPQMGRITRMAAAGPRMGSTALSPGWAPPIG